MWRWVLGVAAVPLVGAVAVVAIGALLPRDHVAAAEALVSAPPERVAAIVREVEAQPKWRKSIRSIEVLEPSDRGLRYVERSDDGAIAFDFAEEEQGRRFRSTIADPTLPFGGSWSIDVAPKRGGSLVRIEERGFVRNPVYRFFSALVFGHDRTVKSYLSDLQAVAIRPGA